MTVDLAPPTIHHETNRWFHNQKGLTMLKYLLLTKIKNDRTIAYLCDHPDSQPGDRNEKTSSEVSSFTVATQ